MCGFICIYTPIWWFGELFLLQYVVNLVLMQLMIYLFKYTVLLGFPAGASGKITHLSMQETWEMPGSISWFGKIPWRRMATHFSILAWRVQWKEEPGRLQSIVSQRVGHDLAHTHNLLLFFYLPVSFVPINLNPCPLV